MEKNATITDLQDAAVALLQRLIATPSLSKNEKETARVIESFLEENGVVCKRVGYNVYAMNEHFDPRLPALLLNSHHDTVAPNKSYTHDPYEPIIRDGKLYGLGANDAGGSLVCLLSAFLFFYKNELPFNIIFAASAEEEISGANGMELLLQHLPEIDMAIVGEPTQMNMAVAEKGLLVLDGVAKGIAGHAARDEGKNAIFQFVTDFNWLYGHTFDKVSPLLGPVHTAITVVETKNKAHNVVPDECHFVIDVRVNELYSFEDILTILRNGLQSTVTPRSLRLQPSSIPADHALVLSGRSLGLSSFGSPTLSDMALMPFPAVKCGPGDSSRSHIADEFIYITEIQEAIQRYIEWLRRLENILKQAS